MKLFRIIFVAAFFAIYCTAGAQITNIPVGKEQEKINTDSLVKEFDSQPFFGIYKDNYFVLGTALNHKPSEFNSDVKFQISFRQRLTKSVLPFHSHLFMSPTGVTARHRAAGTRCHLPARPLSTLA